MIPRSYSTTIIAVILIVFGLFSRATFAAGEIDPSFAAALGISPEGRISDLAIQPDGKIVVAGNVFGLINGVPRANIARLNPDGTLDTSFVPPIFTKANTGNAVMTVALQSNGKILIGGHFTSTNGVARVGIARLNSDGSPDDSFNNGAGFASLVAVENIEVYPDDRILFSGVKAVPEYQGTIMRLSANGTMEAEVADFARDFIFLPDGKILRSHTDGVKRLNADLTVDSTFQNIGLYGKILRQADGKIVVVGTFNTYNGFPVGKIARLNQDGTFDPSFNFGGGGANLTITSIAGLPDGRMIIVGSFSHYNGTLRNKVAILNADGTLFEPFAPQQWFLHIDEVLVQPDGKFLISGWVGQPHPPRPIAHGAIARLNLDGSLDPGFFARTAAGGTAQRTTILPDGRIVVLGAFNEANGIGQTSLARFNTNGTPNPMAVASFSQLIVGTRALDVQPDGKMIVSASASGSVRRYNADGSADIIYPETFGARTIKVLPDGKVLIPALTGSGRFLRRFNADGSVDATFNQPTVNQEIMAMHVQPDGKILIGGVFTQVNSMPRNRIVRLNADGTLDNTFNPTGGANNTIVDIDTQSTGHVIIIGVFSGVNFELRAHIARLNPDGSLDSAFDPVLTRSEGVVDARTLKVQPDDKVLVGGIITATDSIPTGNLIRLTSTGDLDGTFTRGTFTSPINDIALQSDGKIIVVGEFGPEGGPYGIARLLNVNTPASAPFDFDGDGKSDFTVFRPSTNTWYELFSSNQQVGQFEFGAAGDIPAPADYDGDGKTDEAIFRPSTGTWWYQSSINNAQLAVQFGAAGDIPRPSDFDGDGKDDFVLYRQSNSTWYRLGSTGAVSVKQFGIAEDKPVIGDFDGDGKGDLAIYRPSTGVWWYAASGSNDQFRAVQWGAASDVPAPADFDGDGKTDLAVFRPSEGGWYVLRSSNGTYISEQFGFAGDRPIPADYDGDGKADLAVFRPSTGVWYLLQSTAGFGAVQWGVSTDVAIPNAFVP